MRVVFHPDFAKDVRRFQSEYSAISEGLGSRFRRELDQVVEAIMSSPMSAGHFLNLGSNVVRELRRRNLRAFPFFVLYGVTDELVIFGALIPSRSDPLTWLTRFK
jgi:hypothetical protein